MFHSIAASIQLCMLSRDDGRYETSFSHAVVNPHDVLHILRVRGPLHVLLKLQPQRPRRQLLFVWTAVTRLKVDDTATRKRRWRHLRLMLWCSAIGIEAALRVDEHACRLLQAHPPRVLPAVGGLRYCARVLPRAKAIAGYLLGVLCRGCMECALRTSAYGFRLACSLDALVGFLITCRSWCEVSACTCMCFAEAAWSELSSRL